MSALSNWSCRGYIIIEDYEAVRALHEVFGADADVEITLGKIMYQWARKDPTKKIKEVVETREDYKEIHEFHHDLEIPIDGKVRYIETRLIEEKDEPTILVVRFKESYS